MGFAHYRRYPAPKRILGTASINDVLTGGQALSLLSHHKILLPRRRRYYIETLYSHYAHTADAKHLDETREIIRRDCPDYLESFDEVIGRSWGWMFNMFIMPKQVSDEYCEWLFPLLFRLADNIGTEGMSAFEMRYPARTAELLFNVWLEHQAATGGINPEEVCEIPYVYTERLNWPRKIFGFLAAKFLHRRYTKSF